MSRTHDSRPSQLKLKLPTSPSRQRSIENPRYIPSTQIRTPKQHKNTQRFTSTPKPTSNNPAHASSAAGHSRFEPQRNHALSTQTRASTFQHTHPQKQHRLKKTQLVGLAGFEPGSIAPEATSLDQASRQPRPQAPPILVLKP